MEKQKKLSSEEIIIQIEKAIKKLGEKCSNADIVNETGIHRNSVSKYRKNINKIETQIIDKPIQKTDAELKKEKRLSDVATIQKRIDSMSSFNKWKVENSKVKEPIIKEPINTPVEKKVIEGSDLLDELYLQPKVEIEGKEDTLKEEIPYNPIAAKISDGNEVKKRYVEKLIEKKKIENEEQVIKEREEKAVGATERFMKANKEKNKTVVPVIENKKHLSSNIEVISGEDLLDELKVSNKGINNDSEDEELSDENKAILKAIEEDMNSTIKEYDEENQPAENETTEQKENREFERVNFVMATAQQIHQLKFEFGLTNVPPIEYTNKYAFDTKRRAFFLIDEVPFEDRGVAYIKGENSEEEKIDIENNLLKTKKEEMLMKKEIVVSKQQKEEEIEEVIVETAKPKVFKIIEANRAECKRLDDKYISQRESGMNVADHDDPQLWHNSLGKYGVPWWQNPEQKKIVLEKYNKSYGHEIEDKRKEERKKIFFNKI